MRKILNRNCEKDMHSKNKVSCTIVEIPCFFYPALTGSKTTTSKIRGENENCKWGELPVNPRLVQLIFSGEGKPR